MINRLIIYSLLVMALVGCATSSQNDLTGDWAGTLSIGGANLRLVFHITESENGPSVTVESVDEENTMIPAAMIVDGDSITFIIESLNVEYIASFMGDRIVGDFTQFGNHMSDFTIIRN